MKSFIEAENFTIKIKKVILNWAESLRPILKSIMMKLFDWNWACHYPNYTLIEHSEEDSYKNL